MGARLSWLGGGIEGGPAVANDVYGGVSDGGSRLADVVHRCAWDRFQVDGHWKIARVPQGGPGVSGFR